MKVMVPCEAERPQSLEFWNTQSILTDSVTKIIQGLTEEKEKTCLFREFISKNVSVE